MGLGPLQSRRKLFAYSLLAGFTLLSSLITGIFLSTPAHAAAGINQQINFQGRLLNAQGATVADGYYNIQFKIYQDGDGLSVGNTTGSPAGTLKWTESHLNANSQGVVVRNGFLSVQLGSVTAFGSSVDWNQDTIWLSMNIAGTNGSCTPFASCSPDGEMVPMKRMSANAYALNALNANLLGGLSSAGFIQNSTTVQTNTSLAIQSAADANVTGFFQGRTDQSVATVQLKHGAAQSGDYLRLVDSNDVRVMAVDTYGNAHFDNALNVTKNVGIGPAGSTAGVQLRISPTNSTTISLELLGAGTASGTNILQVGGNGGGSVAYDGAGTLKTTSGDAQTAATGSFKSANTAGTQADGLLIDRNGGGGTTTNGIAVKQTDGTLTNGLSFSGTIGTDITRGSGTLTANGGSGIDFKTNGTTTASLSSTGTAIFKNSTDSATAFQVQNTSSQSIFTADSANSNLLLLPNNTSSLSTWTTSTAMSVGANTTRVRGGAIAANGYLYHIGGVDGTGTTIATVQYARLNADGTVGSWASTTALPEARKQFQPVVANGYLYVIAGRNNSNAVLGTAYYAKLNADGTVGSWNTTTALTNGGAAYRFESATVAYNGYMYVIGGFDQNVAAMSTVLNAKINPDGTLGSWGSTAALPETLAAINGVAANGYVYVAGGADASSGEDDISYAKFNPDGTLGSWTAQANVLNNTGGGDDDFIPFVANGYLYMLGGDNGARVVSFPLNSDGSVNSAISLTSLPINPLGEAGFASANGYFYLLGGSSASDGGGTVRNTVYYASTPRVKVGGGLDLVGYGGENLNEGGSGGSLTAGNTIIVGTMQVQDTASFARGASVMGTLSVAGDTALKAATNSTATFEIQSSSAAKMLTVNTSSNAIVVGQAAGGTAASAALYFGDTCSNFTQTCLKIGEYGGTDSDNLQLHGATGLTFTTGYSTVTPTGVMTSSNFYLGNGATAAAPTNFTIRGTGSSTTGVAGGALSVQGGSATVGNANGGNLNLSGGTGIGTGASGLVVISTPTFSTTANDPNCYTGGVLVASSCTIAIASVNNSSAIIAGFSTTGQIATLPDPTITTAGRVVYVTAANGSSDFTLRVNSGGTGNDIAMRQNTSATMMWNGSDWTAAGASSSTTLQSAYDNTLQSAGGAELIISRTSTTNGLTIRDSSTNPVNGTLVSVQTSSAAVLLSVNSNVTEYATDAGAEVAGNGGASTFPASTWSSGGSATVSRYTTAGDFVATGQGSVSVATTTGGNDGTKDTLATTLTSNTTYNVSFTTRLSSGTFTDMNVYYSVDGTAASVACKTNQAVATSVWTKVNCAFTAPASGITSTNAILIRQTASGTARTFYVDNLSVTIAADYNYATDGTVANAANFTTNWSSVSSATISRSTTVGNDASDSAQVVTTGTGQGVRNKLSINPLTSTLYRVTAYSASTTSGFSTFTVRYSRDGGTNFVNCADYNTQTVSSSTTDFTKITCYITTDSTAAADPYIYFTQSDATGRTFYVDTFSMTLSANTTPNVQIGGGINGGPTTLFTLDKGASAPIASNNEALLGSMYYDTTLGKLQCYEADGWGACGSSPDHIVTISPEYTNAVMHGTGVGTMTSDICSDTLNINDGSSGQSTICGTNETYNFYKWTSPQATAQTYSVFVTYQLPNTFKSFLSGQASLMGRTDSTNSTVQYQIYRQSTGSGLVACGSLVSVSTGSAASWQTGTASGAADPSTCGFTPGSSIVFKIDVIASQNASAYVGNLNFAFNNN